MMEGIMAEYKAKLVTKTYHYFLNDEMITVLYANIPKTGTMGSHIM